MSSNQTVRKHWKPDETMRFGVFWPYSRTLIPSAEISRRNPDVLDVENHIALAQAAEAVGFDFALIADGYSPASEANSRIGFQDPSTHAVLWAPSIFAATRNLGVLSTIHTGFLHPVVIARMGAHLDHLSGGRWGWNVVNGFRPHEAKLFGFDKLDHDGGYDLSDEALGIIKTLWSDPADGIKHHGTYFKIEGKLRRPLPPAKPLLVSAASSARGRAFAARHCEYLFASPATASDVLDMAADLTQAATVAGRDTPPQVLMLADVFIRDEAGRASEEYASLMDSRDDEALKVWSSHLANTQFRGKKPEDVPAFLGNAAEVAEQIISLHRESALTGILCRFPLWHAEEALRLGKVLAILAKAGVWIPPQGRDFSW